MFKARNALDKAKTVGWSKNAGVWGRIPQPPESNGGRRQSPRRCSDFTAFSKKLYF